MLAWLYIQLTNRFLKSSEYIRTLRTYVLWDTASVAKKKKAWGSDVYAKCRETRGHVIRLMLLVGLHSCVHAIKPPRLQTKYLETNIRFHCFNKKKHTFCAMEVMQYSNSMN